MERPPALGVCLAGTKTILFDSRPIAPVFSPLGQNLQIALNLTLNLNIPETIKVRGLKFSHDISLKLLYQFLKFQLATLKMEELFRSKVGSTQEAGFWPPCFPMTSKRVRS